MDNDLILKHVTNKLLGFKGFRLFFLELQENRYLGNIKLDFTDLKDHNESFYSSVLIGSNGTGKSYILRTIIDIFRELHFAITEPKNKRFTSGRYNIIYGLEGDVYQYSNIKTFKLSDQPQFEVAGEEPRTFLKKNDIDISINAAIIPERILASSIMLWDRFPVISKDDEFTKEYNYLGIRNENSPSTAGTKQLIRKTVEHITSSAIRVDGEQFLNSLRELLVDLRYEKKLSISYVPKYRFMFWKKDLNYDSFCDMFTNWQKNFTSRKTEPWGKRYFDKIKENRKLIEQLIEFMNGVNLIPYGSGGRLFEYDILSDYSLTNSFFIIEHLGKLDLISAPSIKFYKANAKFELSKASSGEVQIITALIGILATIKENSLILIDEPEISLHPNWQMKYMQILRKMFENYKSCHFIIATHSHFIVSDLKGDDSRIIGLRRDNEQGIEKIDLGKSMDTFGWSAEEVLYRIFNVKSTRNYYLENDLYSLVNIVNRNTKEWEKLGKIIDKINALTLSENDPLKILLEKGTKYYQTRNA